MRDHRDAGVEIVLQADAEAVDAAPPRGVVGAFAGGIACAHGPGLRDFGVADPDRPYVRITTRD